MDYENFSKLVMQRQACREFNDKPLSRETVEKIVDLSRFTPSACNSQPWKMYVACGDKLESVISALTEGGRNAFLSKAKSIIVLSEKATTMKPDVLKKFSLDHFVKYDVGELAAYITLTAESLGVSNIVIGWIDEKRLKNAVGMGEEEACSIVVALGYSDAPIRQKTRLPKEKTVKYLD